MPRVDFYLLSDESGMQKFACIMASKAWSAGNHVYMHTETEDTAKSAEVIKNEQLRGVAAIAGEMAARISLFNKNT